MATIKLFSNADDSERIESFVNTNWNIVILISNPDDLYSGASIELSFEDALSFIEDLREKMESFNGES